jgi:hypothetical protein
MIFKHCPRHKLLWEFHLEGVSTGIYLWKTGIYVSKIVQTFQLLTFSTKQVTEMWGLFLLCPLYPFLLKCCIALID